MSPLSLASITPAGVAAIWRYFVRLIQHSRHLLACKLSLAAQVISYSPPRELARRRILYSIHSTLYSSVYMCHACACQFLDLSEILSWCEQQVNRAPLALLRRAFLLIMLQCRNTRLHKNSLWCNGSSYKSNIQNVLHIENPAKISFLRHDAYGC